jgi:hypothetical protein
MMQRLTGAVESVVDNLRRMARRGPSGEDQRQTFYREFGQYPPNFEAPKSERERFGREVVQPVLTQRAQAVQQADAQTKRTADEAFARAYQLAVGLKVAKKGQTYQDYLGPRA